jgi:two-component system sensor histidine kinase CpxA
MNSVYGRLVLWGVVTVLLGFNIVIGVGLFSAMHGKGNNMPSRYDSVLVDDAVAAYRTGGTHGLQEQLARFHAHLKEHYYLTDADGVDLLTGEHRLPGVNHHGIETNAYPSPDGTLKLVAVSRRTFSYSSFIPYHGLLLVTVAVLCAALAANLASPLRRLAQTVDRFGAGDLSARVNSKRKDEIGDVGRAFDRMADRIATLLTAERRLLQDISHELRSPLARLTFAAELARTAPDRDAAVNRLKKEIARLTDLVGALIQVTRAEGDPEAAEHSVLRFDELVTAVVEDCRFEAAQRPCEIALTSSSGPVYVQGDRELLRRAVENVLRNAIRYTAAGSSIEVGRNATRLFVRDYGPGVPPEALEKIFAPFFRLDNARDASTGGVGLGLAIAHRAIALHHGRLWAENTEPGLRVWIEVPEHAAPENPATP